MENSIFQTFLLFAYFDISLIAITIANYAVSASYLGRETRLSRQRMERKEAELLRELSEPKKKPKIAEIEKKLKESQAERSALGRRIFLLSWLGAVILPSLFFLSSFILAVVGMNSEIILLDNPEFLQQQSIIFSVGTTAAGFMVLLNVIRVIDSAAKSIPVPEFKVYFAGGLTTEKCKGNEKKEIIVVIENTGEAIGEDLDAFIMFPPEFKVHQSSGYEITKQGITSEYPDYNAAILNRPKMHAGISGVLAISLTTPEKKGVYEVPVAIYERKIGKVEGQLVIEIVSQPTNHVVK